MITDPPPPSESVLNALRSLPSPSYLIEESAIRKNCQILKRVAEASGAKIVLAQKAFAQPQLYPLIGRYLDGACASGAWEAALGRKYFKKEAEVITCSPAYSQAEIEELLKCSDHIDFNSLTQWRFFKDHCLRYNAVTDSARKPQFGLRINPECSTGETPLYDPCAVGSRLGITAGDLQSCSPTLLEGLSGLHFHTLCEQGVEDLMLTLKAVEANFGWFLRKPECVYLNLGGGHWITKDGYDREALVSVIQYLTAEYNLQIYLEPGEAVVIHSGVLSAQVLDLHKSGEVVNALLNISATAHMPDVLEMPYRPEVYLLSGEQGTEAGAYQYRLGGVSCLAGDQVGDYAFQQPLEIGDHLLFNDMAHYTMVKTTFFNGVQHPSIYLLREEGEVECLRRFTFYDYEGLKSEDR